MDNFSQIARNRELIQQLEGQEIVLLFGLAGGGKSTIYQLFRGGTVEEFAKTKTEITQQVYIGEIIAQRQTKQRKIVDTPSFGDLISSVCIFEAVSICTSVIPILIVQHETIQNNRGAVFRELLQNIIDMCQDYRKFQQNLIILITHVRPDISQEKIIEELKGIESVDSAANSEALKIFLSATVSDLEQDEGKTLIFDINNIPKNFISKILRTVDGINDPKSVLTFSLTKSEQCKLKNSVSDEIKKIQNLTQITFETIHENVQRLDLIKKVTGNFLEIVNVFQQLHHKITAENKTLFLTFKSKLQNRSHQENLFINLTNLSQQRSKLERFNKLEVVELQFCLERYDGKIIKIIKDNIDEQIERCENEKIEQFAKLFTRVIEIESILEFIDFTSSKELLIEKINQQTQDLENQLTSISLESKNVKSIEIFISDLRNVTLLNHKNIRIINLQQILDKILENYANQCQSQIREYILYMKSGKENHEETEQQIRKLKNKFVFLEQLSKNEKMKDFFAILLQRIKDTQVRINKVVENQFREIIIKINTLSTGRLSIYQEIRTEVQIINQFSKIMINTPSVNTFTIENCIENLKKKIINSVNKIEKYIFNSLNISNCGIIHNKFKEIENSVWLDDLIGVNITDQLNKLKFRLECKAKRLFKNIRNNWYNDKRKIIEQINQLLAFEAFEFLVEQICDTRNWLVDQSKKIADEIKELLIKDEQFPLTKAKSCLEQILVIRDILEQLGLEEEMEKIKDELKTFIQRKISTSENEIKSLLTNINSQDDCALIYKRIRDILDELQSGNENKMYETCKDYILQLFRRSNDPAIQENLVRYLASHIPTISAQIDKKIDKAKKKFEKNLKKQNYSNAAQNFNKLSQNIKISKKCTLEDHVAKLKKSFKELLRLQIERGNFDNSLVSDAIREAVPLLDTINSFLDDSLAKKRQQLLNDKKLEFIEWYKKYEAFKQFYECLEYEKTPLSKFTSIIQTNDDVQSMLSNHLLLHLTNNQFVQVDKFYQQIKSNRFTFHLAESIKEMINNYLEQELKKCNYQYDKVTMIANNNSVLRREIQMKNPIKQQSKEIGKSLIITDFNKEALGKLSQKHKVAFGKGNSVTSINLILLEDKMDSVDTNDFLEELSDIMESWGEFITIHFTFSPRECKDLYDHMILQLEILKQNQIITLYELRDVEGSSKQFHAVVLNIYSKNKFPKNNFKYEKYEYDTNDEFFTRNKESIGNYFITINESDLPHFLVNENQLLTVYSPKVREAVFRDILEPNIIPLELGNYIVNKQLLHDFGFNLKIIDTNQSDQVLVIIDQTNATSTENIISAKLKLAEMIKNFIANSAKEKLTLSLQTYRNLLSEIESKFSDVVIKISSMKKTYNVVQFKIEYFCSSANEKSMFASLLSQQPNQAFFTSLSDLREEIASFHTIAQLKTELKTLQKEKEKEIKKIKKQYERDIANLKESREKAIKRGENLLKLMPLTRMELKSNDFKVIAVVGSGCNGTVFHCEIVINKEVFRVALKMISNFAQMTSNTLRKACANEFMILRDLEAVHPNIIHILSSFNDTPTKSMMDSLEIECCEFLYSTDARTGIKTPVKTQFFVTELHSMTLERKLNELGNKINLETILRYSLEIANCFLFLFNNYIVHRDVKLDNLLISEDDRIILSDFGESIKTDLSYRCRKCDLRSGSTLFTAPEILNSIQQAKDTDCIDFRSQYSWEVGCLIYNVAFGSFPFPGYPTGFGVEPNVTVPLLQFPLLERKGETIPEELLCLIRELLANAGERIEIEQAVEKLKKMG